MSSSAFVSEQLDRRVRLSTDLEEAARALAPFWSLESFIAVNPLDGLRADGFEQATQTAARAYGSRGHLSESQYLAFFESGRIGLADLEQTLAERFSTRGEISDVTGQLVRAAIYGGSPVGAVDKTRMEELEQDAGVDIGAVDDLVSKWCAAYFDRGEAAWQMPQRERGLYAAWRELASHAAEGRSLGVNSRALRRAASSLPEDPADAAIELLAQLAVAPQRRVAYLRRLLCRRPGWPAYIKYQLREPDQPRPVDLTQFVAIALFYETIVASVHKTPDASASEKGTVTAACGGQLSESERLEIWQAAYERGPRDSLLASIESNSAESPKVEAEAQVVFCIDPRSESVRRHLEAIGDFETVGFAGFFGMPVRWHNVAGGAPVDLCPALLTPHHNVKERFRQGSERSGARVIEREAREAAAREVFHLVKDDTSSKFALAEAGGWLAGPRALSRTLAPGLGSGRRQGDAHLQTEPWLDTSPAVDPSRQNPAADQSDALADGLSLDEQVLWSEAALRTMGLTDSFAPVVLFCGHGSTSTNNPHGSALDCGACGGQRGGRNARIAASLLNRRAVRASLAETGIVIPEETWFMAGEHDTSTDTFELLDLETIPASHAQRIARLAADLQSACDARLAERAPRLPGVTGGPRAAARARRRAIDWSEVRPEWGLMGNYAFVAGPRELTADLDLRERVFLHSYDAAADPSGAQLEGILTAPLVVAHWINMQYYFSTVAPATFSAGSKVLHNVVGRLGVVQGAGGDLRIGLPSQSVLAGGKLAHEPMRLLAVVEAPFGRIDAVVERNQILQELFDGGWVTLAARDPHERAWRLLDRQANWIDWTDPTAVPATETSR